MSSITTTLTITRPDSVVVTVELSATEVKISYEDSDHPGARTIQKLLLSIPEDGAMDLNLSAGAPSDKE
jgi:hypothetical protein